MIRIYFIGVCILLLAIIANVLASKFGLVTWYDFLNVLYGAHKNKLETNLLDYIWLFLGYPLVLGLGYKLGDWVYGGFSVFLKINF